MSVLAIIPARGGSKGIPGKNVRIVAGKPLLAHSILQARQAPSIDRVVVSTDDAEIGRVAEEYGADVVWRPAEISNDTATSESALRHVLDEESRQGRPDPDLVVFLQGTSPVRAEDDIDRAIETLRREGADSLVSVVPFHVFIWRRNADTAWPIDYDPRSRPRRQDRDPEYMENGSIYVFKPWVLRTFDSRLGGKIALHVMDDWSFVDINDERDLELCEWVMLRHQVSTAPQRHE